MQGKRNLTGKKDYLMRNSKNSIELTFSQSLHFEEKRSKVSNFHLPNDKNQEVLVFQFSRLDFSIALFCVKIVKRKFFFEFETLLYNRFPSFLPPKTVITAQLISKSQ